MSATLARAESLAEIVPHPVGTICKYLDAQVGVVLLYNAERHRLEVMSLIWVNGYPLETDPIVLDVASPAIVAQVYPVGPARSSSGTSTRTPTHVLLRELGLRQGLVPAAESGEPESRGDHRGRPIYGQLQRGTAGSTRLNGCSGRSGAVSDRALPRRRPR